MEGKKKKLVDMCQTPGIEQGSGSDTFHVSANYAIRSVVPNGSY